MYKRNIISERFIVKLYVWTKLKITVDHTFGKTRKQRNIENNPQ